MINTLTAAGLAKRAERAPHGVCVELELNRILTRTGWTTKVGSWDANANKFWVCVLRLFARWIYRCRRWAKKSGKPVAICWKICFFFVCFHVLLAALAGHLTLFAERCWASRICARQLYASYLRFQACSILARCLEWNRRHSIVAGKGQRFPVNIIVRSIFVFIFLSELVVLNLFTNSAYTVRSAEGRPHLSFGRL